MIKTKKNVVIYNTSLDEYEGIGAKYTRLFDNDNLGIRKILSHFQLNNNVHFFLRVHPNLSGVKNAQTIEIDELASDFPNCTVIHADEKVDTYALCENSDLTLTFNSTMGIESVFWGTPSILMGRAYYEDLNCIYVPKNVEELFKMIIEVNSTNKKDDYLKYGYWEETRGTEFKYFKPKGISDGLFMDKKVELSPFKKLSFKIISKLEK